ncbi:hypothetical protein BD311DRAFT_682859 [Dichomitus squalens]|uniref:Pentacotripeptide-repeat region of PRORP domain-containing protein n=1 Tax=Dichomitus squalens TaxID=114155 RepID=A0A4Q9N2I2_9APHY|nr:hypothetical protein BD311DRAFT_682859 [Dichomitus squalens]
MLLRRAFVEGRRIQARHPLRPRSSIHSRTTSLAAQPTQQHVNKPRESTTHQVSDRAFIKEIEHFHAVVSAGGKTPRPAFNRLRGCVGMLSDASSLLQEPSKSLLEEALLRLCRSPYPHDCTIVKDGLLMSAQLLGVAAADYAADVFNRLVDKSDVRSALDWLWVTGKMSGIDVGYALVLAPWHRLLEVGAGNRNEYLIANALTKMERLKVSPTVDTGRIIVAAMFRSASLDKARPPPSYDTMKHLINLFHSAGIPYDEHTLSVIKEGYTDADEEIGRRVELLYTSTLVRPGTGLSEARMHEALATTAANGTRKQVLRQLRRFQEVGLRPSEDTLFAVLGGDAKIDDYEYWCKTLGVSGGSKAAAKVMQNVLAAGGSSGPRLVEFYQHERNKGYTVSSYMLHFAIQALLSSALDAPSERAVETALALYRDFIREDDAASPDKDDHSRRKHPEPRTYQLLLRTLTRSYDKKYLPVAISLMDDMRRFDVDLDSQTTASVIILLMRACPTPAESFEAYRLLGKPPDQSDKPNLDEEGYNAILDTFCKLKTWPDGIPSTKHFFQIVTDMRKHGVELNHKAYTIIIGHLARLATAASSAPSVLETGDVRTQIAKSIARVHNHLNVNSGFTPDVALWNQLMDAYQRAGCFTEACRIWQKLFATRTFNNVSVSIIIDACAFNQAHDMAVRVFTGLVDSGYPMNVRNWNTLLECLCRLDRIDEAMKVLCLEMMGREDGIEPDKESIRILLKFAAKHGQEPEVRSKVKRFLPKLYYSLQSEMGWQS